MSTTIDEAVGGGCPYHEAVAAAPRCPVVHGEAYDPLDPKQTDDPYPWMEAARKEAPVFYMPEQDLWCVTRYEDVLAVMRDDETFSARNAIVPIEMTGPLAKVFPDGHPIRHSLLMKDPPEHNVVRKVAQRNFTPKAIATYEPMVRRRVDALIDAFVDDKQCELVSQFTGKLPPQVVCDIIGIPEAEGQTLASWADDTMRLFKGAPPLSEQENADLAERARPVMEWLIEFVNDRRENPREDLTSDLLRATRPDGTPVMGTNEVVGFIDSLLIAGVGTTKNFIALAMREFLSRPDQWNQIKEDRSLLPNAMEEALRYRTPSRGSRRMTTREVELGGVTIPKGANIHLMLFSPQRDETVFENPNEFDIHRENAKKHFAFGKWTHMCLGSNLAKLEARISFERFLDRLPNVRLAEGQEYSWVPNMTIAEFRTLHLEWD